MPPTNPSGEQESNPFDTDSYNNSWNKNGPFERYKPLAEPFEQVIKYRFILEKAARMSKPSLRVGVIRFHETSSGFPHTPYLRGEDTRESTAILSVESRLNGPSLL